jgi:adenylosuccinate lyase
MQRNLDALGGLHNSQRVLLALTQAGVSREDAYAIVQRHAMGVWQDLNKGGPDFLARLKADPEVTQVLKPAELEALFDLEYHLAHVDAIFARVFGVMGSDPWKGTSPG